MPEIRYGCKYCKDSYATEREALLCEDRHLKPVKIVEVKWDKRLPTPTMIGVECEGGVIRYFVFKPNL